MRSILTNGASDALDRVIDLASSQPIAVLCVEREQNRCRREVITGMAVERNPEIEVLQVL